MLWLKYRQVAPELDTGNIPLGVCAIAFSYINTLFNWTLIVNRCAGPIGLKKVRSVSLCKFKWAFNVNGAFLLTCWHISTSLTWVLQCVHVVNRSSVECICQVTQCQLIHVVYPIHIRTVYWTYYLSIPSTRNRYRSLVLAWGISLSVIGRIQNH